LSIGFIWVTFDRKRQGWHDKIAGTYVIYVEDEFSGADAVQFVPSDAHQRNWIWLVVWVVMALVVPGALVAGLLVLGPVVAKLLTSIAP
jgi:hypothetical protein